jgi:hypothetical protein
MFALHVPVGIVRDEVAATQVTASVFAADTRVLEIVSPVVIAALVRYKSTRSPTCNPGIVVVSSDVVEDNEAVDHVRVPAALPGLVGVMMKS